MSDTEKRDAPVYNIDIEKTPEEEQAELEYLRRVRDGRANPLEEAAKP